MTEHGRPRFDRRRFLGGGAAGAVGLGVGAATSAVLRDTAAGEPATEPFYGPNQAGIATAAQARVAFVALDLRPGTTRDDLAGALRIWTGDAARLTQGRPALADTEPELARRPARLTVTIGLGSGVFERCGLDGERPLWLAPLPPFPIDRLDPAFCGGDLLLQVCAGESTTVAHAVRVLCRSVRSLMSVRWVQRGFRDAAPGTTPRNLMGQLDGTADIAGPEFDRLVWDDGSAHPWLAGGTAMVLRRIAMTLDTWDEIDPAARELTVGRALATGAPLTGTDEFDEPDFAAVDTNGIAVIPPSSHIARAHHRHAGERFHRRGYNYDDAPGPGAISNSGLLFTAYQRDPRTQFLPVQRRLAEFDALNVWTTPVGSAVFVIPPGARDSDDYIGATLLES